MSDRSVLAFEQRQQVRERMLVLTERLVAEYAGVVPAGSVMRCVARSWVQVRSAGPGGDVVARTEAAARRHLPALASAHGIA